MLWILIANGYGHMKPKYYFELQRYIYGAIFKKTDKTRIKLSSLKWGWVNVVEDIFLFLCNDMDYIGISFRIFIVPLVHCLLDIFHFGLYLACCCLAKTLPLPNLRGCGNAQQTFMPQLRWQLVPRYLKTGFNAAFRI